VAATAKLKFVCNFVDTEKSAIAMKKGRKVLKNSENSQFFF